MAMPVRALAMAAPACLEFTLVAKLQQGIKMFCTLEVHATPAAAVATRGSAARDEFLPAERHAAIAAVAACHADYRLVNEHEWSGSELDSAGGVSFSK